MTGNEVLSRVFNLLGYINSASAKIVNDNLFKRGPDVINQICNDLNINCIIGLSDKINADSKSLDALCYGVAMIMALVEGDGDKNKVFADIYNAKRATVLSSKEFIEDKLPIVSYGVD